MVKKERKAESSAIFYYILFACIVFAESVINCDLFFVPLFIYVFIDLLEKRFRHFLFISLLCLRVLCKKQHFKTCFLTASLLPHEKDTSGTTS